MKRSLKHIQGFSLVELLVVVSIFIIITSVVIFNQNKFSSDISISNVAYRVALDIRKAQVYGILVRDDEVDFEGAYGIHFRKKRDNTVEYFLFADSQRTAGENNYLIYDGDNGDDQRITPIYSLAEGNVFKNICTYDSSGRDEKCFFSAGIQAQNVDIVFKRPEPSAIITDSTSGTRKRRVDITITSSLGDKTHTIKTFSSGQISVYNN